MKRIDDVLQKEPDLDLAASSKKVQDSKYYQEEIKRQEKELERLKKTVDRIEKEKVEAKKGERWFMVITLIAGAILGVGLIKLFELFFG